MSVLTRRRRILKQEKQAVVVTITKEDLKALIHVCEAARAFYDDSVHLMSTKRGDHPILCNSCEMQKDVDTHDDYCLAEKIRLALERVEL